VSGRESGIKMGGVDGGEDTDSPDEVEPIWVGTIASVILPAPSKIRRMESTINDIGCNPVGAPTCLHKQEVRKPSQNAAQHCAKAEGCVNDDPRCRVGTWNVDSLTRRAGK